MERSSKFFLSIILMPLEPPPFSPIKTKTSCSIESKTKSSNVIKVILLKWVDKKSLNSSAYATCKISAGITNAIVPVSDNNCILATKKATQALINLLGFMPCDERISACI